jgi:hypothetical protein
LDYDHGFIFLRALVTQFLRQDAAVMKCAPKLNSPRRINSGEAKARDHLLDHLPGFFDSALATNSASEIKRLVSEHIVISALQDRVCQSCGGKVVNRDRWNGASIFACKL